MAAKGVQKKERALPSLVPVLFSWTLQDILNENLYKNKVEKIPETFTSIKHYLNSYVVPLIEETHADMSLSMKILPQAPTCEIKYIEESKSYNPPIDSYYNAKIGQHTGEKNKSYEPQKWDVIVLSDVKPMCINDLGGPSGCYLPAIVTRGVDKDNRNMLQILTSKPITLKQQHGNKRGALNATFLINITTNIRILRALEGGKNTDIIKQVLNAESKVEERCAICSQENHILMNNLHADLHLSNLNESQISAVLSSIEASQCSHKNSVRLIWGPPGTGKTKTIVTLLWELLRMKSRTLTCAPTNIAVVEAASRLLKLVEGSIEGGLYGLGDIILFGNEERMKLDDHDYLNVIFLDYRSDRLAECFAPLSGWRYRLDSMITFLDDPVCQYRQYFKNTIRKKKEKTGHAEKYIRVSRIKIRNFTRKRELLRSIVGQGKDETVDEVLSFWEFIRKEFGRLLKDLKHCMLNLCIHLPTSCIPVREFEKMSRALYLLKSLKALSKNDTFSNKELDMIFIVTKECLQVLRSSREEFLIPNICDKSLIRSFCLQNACAVFCTASSSANLSTLAPFKLLVIDEAAQLKECESLIPLQLPCIQHAILIGDERQLPAMIKSKTSEKAGLGRSLFERLISLGQRKHLLDIQYRMHPSISLFPNTEFYKKQIYDAPNVKDRNYKKNLLQGDMYGSYSFINVTYGKDEIGCRCSWRNICEVAVISEIIAKLYQASVDSGQMVSVGVMSPYKAQVFALKEKLGDQYGTQGDFSVSVSSVDGFQGGEKDVIIMSTVRSNQNGYVGFLSNRRRTNVALTRARCCLWIVGNGPTLVNSGSVWEKLVRDAQDRRCYFDVDEDKTLIKAIINSMLDLYQLEELMDANSLLFKNARWKVLFCDEFRKSLAGITDVETQKEVVSLLMKLSSGWRDPTQTQRNITLMDGVSCPLLERYKIDGLLNLLWTVDILEEGSHLIQVLKFWDILPLIEIPEFSRHLDNIFGRYMVGKISCCRLTCRDGNVEVPISWNTGQDALSRRKLQGTLRECSSSWSASDFLNKDTSKRAQDFIGPGSCRTSRAVQES